MLRIRKILLIVSLFVGLGSLGISFAYGWYLHSDAYRQRFEQRIGRFLNLDVRIGRASPLTFDSVSLHEIRAHLPDRREEIFACKTADWIESWERSIPRFDLVLSEGRLILGSPQRTWEKPDYQRILQSGLAHNFAELNLQRVQLQAMELHVHRPLWNLKVAGAEGTVLFKDMKGKASAELKADQINGFEVQAPIHISALFTPGKTVTFHRVALRVPRMPVRYLNIDELLSSKITQGFFKGEIVYRDDPLIVEVGGTAEGLSLAELTARLPTGALSGRITRLYVDEASFEQGRLVELAFRGRIEDLAVPNVAALMDLPDVGGELNIEVSKGLIAHEMLHALEVRGTADGIDLPTLTRLAGIGEISGSLKLHMRHLAVEEGEVVSAEIDAIVQPPADGLPTIDREVLRAASDRLFDVELPALPFEELEYVHFGAKLLINENRLRLAGLYGDGGNTILSIRLLGQEIPVIRAPDRTFDFEAILEALRPVAEQYELPEWLRRRRISAPGP